MMSDDMQDPILYMLTGLPFSGKSTLAKQLAEALQMKVLSYTQHMDVNIFVKVPCSLISPSFSHHIQKRVCG